ncbi:hypothetical protein [Streptomyces formicae]
MTPVGEPRAVEYDALMKSLGLEPSREDGRRKKGQRAAQCGTYSGYERHRQRGEPADAACLAAKAAYRRRYYAENRERIQAQRARKAAERHPTP